MPDNSPRLTLPMILPAQAQKHVTHNEALTVLDTLVQLVFEGVDAETPPGGASEGDTWALGALPTGEWDGQSGKIAAYQNGGWMFIAPQDGWRGWDKDTGELRVYTGGTWAAQASGGTPTLQNLTGLGIGATSDSVNRLSVSSEATLLNNAGAGHQVKVNKTASTDTASLLFQTNWSGRAEMGTSGSDDFAIKVSADGASFVSGLTLKADTGVAEVQAVSGPGHYIADDAALLIPTPTTAGFVLVTVAGSDPRADVSAITVQDTGATPQLQSLFATPLVEMLTGALGGTDATDGALGLSAVTGGIWVENRLGSGQSVSVTFVGGL
jgi:hypothetical protein